MRCQLRTAATVIISLLCVFSQVPFAYGSTPVISYLSQPMGTSGTTITIHGSFGTTQGTVEFGDTSGNVPPVSAQVTSWTSTAITVIVPAFLTGQSYFQVVVGGTGSNQVIFALTNPYTYALVPPHGTAGTVVTIWGTNFGSSQGSTSTLTFDGITAEPTTWSNNSIVVPVPNGVANGSITVQVTVGGLPANSQTFTVSSKPFISYLSSNSAPPGAEVTVTGVNFGASPGSSTVTFNGVPATPIEWNDTTISTTVPAGATTGNVVVTVGKTGSNAVAFMVTPAANEGGAGFVQGTYSTAVNSMPLELYKSYPCYQAIPGNGLMITDIEVPYPVEQNHGDLNLVIVETREKQIANVSLVDGDGNSSYYQINQQTQSGNGNQWIWYNPNIVGGENWITVVFSSTYGCVTSPEVRIAEYRGISTGSGALDLSASYNSTGSTSCSSNSSAFRTSNSNDVLIGANLVGQNTSTTAAGANYTERVVTPGGNILEDEIVTAKGGYSATATMSKAGNCIMQMLAFKEAPNQAPVVNAGPNQTISLPTNSVTLDGTATDDGLPNGTLAISWSQVSGPGTATFSSPTTPVTNVVFPTAGVYVLELTANDSQLSSSATVTVTVNNIVVAATLSAVQTETVLITPFTGPWSLSGGLNSSYVYGNSGTSPPVTFPVVAGEQVSLQYISGTVSIREILGLNYDANGCTDPTFCPFTGRDGYGVPNFYGSQYQNGGSLIGAWTDATGQLITRPFAVNDGATVTAPSGAALLQLGVSDSYYNDNGSSSGGGWTIQIQAGVPVLGVGPNVTGTSQTVNAYVTAGGAPVVNGAVQFTVTGANPTTTMQSTNSYGVATFTYTGANQGTDTVQAAYQPGYGTYATNAVSVSWVTPVNIITTTAALGKFFVGNGSCTFNTVPTAPPAFSQEFPGITFNPPANFVPGNTTITDFTIPFTDVTTDKNGDFTGAIVAQGNGYQAGAGAMSAAFQAEFSGSFVVSKSGNAVLNMIADGGFILGIGGGATRISGVLVGAPASGVTSFQNLAVMGAYNQAVTNGPANYNITAYFPSPGTYPFELDYTVCNGGPTVPMTMTMGTGSTGSGVPTPSAGSLSLTPINPQSIQVGNTETFTVLAVDGSGAPIPNLSVLSNIYGANQENLSGTTNAQGQATLQYVGTQAGVDQVQAFSNVDNSVGVSNVVPVTWTGSLSTTCIFVPQGWINAPVIGAVVQSPTSITLASGVTLASGTLTYFPSANPTLVTTLNSNTTGTGPLTLGTFDPTQLANGEYTIQLQAKLPSGTCQLNETVVSVTGQYKPGREVVKVTDFKVPLAGIPISISRNYDSLNRGNVEAFGNGWSFGSDVNLQVDPLLNVTFTLNGNPETFYFAPQSAGQGLFPWLVLPAYSPQPGVHGTLTSNGCNMLVYSGGVLVQDQSGVVCFLGGTYQPTAYTYTDPAGRSYTMACTGANCTTTPPLFELQTIKDLNGNTLTFSSSGITSSSGVNVAFYRDSQNRITKITDPNQNNYLYSYDSPCGTGNLCSVTFPGTTTIQANYTYFSDHSLKTQADPNSNTTTYLYYSANTQNCVNCVGRLQSVTGPMVAGPGGTQTQYVTQYAYNVATNATTTTYPDGGIVTETDDSFGNPLTTIDALNNTTTFTYYSNETLHTKVDPLKNPPSTYAYDSNGFLTSSTDPLNHQTTWTYNQYGGITSTIDAAQQNTVTIGYDAYFNPITSSDSLSSAFGPLYTRTYDSMGDILTQSDANGNTTQFTYDTSGNLLKAVDPLNEITTFTYDNMDRVLTKIDPRGNQTSYIYDALGNLKTITDANSNVWQFFYDFNGNKTSEIDPLNRTTFYFYDALNRLIKTTYPDQTTKQYTYDFRNNKLSETDQAGHVNQYVYDLDGHLKTATYAYGTTDAGTVQYVYDADGNVKTVTDEDNNTTTYNYDAANRLISIQDALKDLTQYGYDADNRRTSMTDANLNKTIYTPDARSRILTVTYQDTTKDQYTYDGVGNQLTFTDQALNKTTRTYDPVYRLLSVTDALTPPSVTTYAYDPAGNLLSITDANSHVTSFQYDNLNHKVQRTLPLGMFETFAHDAVGNVSATTDFNNKTTTYAYDPLNRLLKKIPDPLLSAPTISITYNPTGTRLSMTDASGTTNYTLYDNRNRLKTKVTPEGTLNYTYDAHSNLLTILSSNTNGASVTYTPDQLNRVGTVLDNRLVAQGVSSATTTYTYYPVGTVQNYTYAANSVKTAYTYDTLNRLKTIGSSKSGSGLSNFTYTPYPAGNVQTVAELSGRAVNYVYDTDYHLKSETISADPGNNNGSETYTYDPVGNRLTLNSTIPSLSGSVSFSYDPNDRLASDAYDSDGNTISSLGVPSTYDFENHMLTHGAVTMTYDGDGNRVSETAGGVTTQFLVDTLNPTGYSQVLDELVSGAVTKTFTYGLQRISENQLVSGTWTPSFYGYDGHGNVRFLTNSAGAPVNTYQFDAFGAQIASTGTTANTYLYSGERFDNNLNLYQLRARFYNMLTGRFETMDPELGQILNPATLHKYAYAQSNPVNNVDPTGRGALTEGVYIDLNAGLLTTKILPLAVKIGLVTGLAACPFAELGNNAYKAVEGFAADFDYDIPYDEYTSEILNNVEEWCGTYFPK